MKAVILQNPAPIEEQPLKLVELPEPKPDKGQILIKISVCGACHTDLDEAEGRLTPSKSPVVPGHQVVGTVAARGYNATKFEIGDRVGVTWLYRACGKCSYCKKGNENLCPNAKWTGKDADGGYAEFMVIDEEFAYRIPASFSDEETAPLLCAGVIGYRTFRLAEVKEGETVGLFGFGASAHIVIQIIKHQFPRNRVLVFTKTEEHARLAKSLGAEWTGKSNEEPPEKLNKAMDFTPVGECTRDALNVLDKGGRLVINAIRKETPVPELDYAKYLWLEKEIKSVANVTKKDAEEFLPLAAEIPIRPTIERFALSDANDVLFKIKHSQLRAAAVLNISD